MLNGCRTRRLRRSGHAAVPGVAGWLCGCRNFLLVSAQTIGLSNKPPGHSLASGDTPRRPPALCATHAMVSALMLDGENACGDVLHHVLVSRPCTRDTFHRARVFDDGDLWRSPGESAVVAVAPNFPAG